MFFSTLLHVLFVPIFCLAAMPVAIVASVATFLGWMWLMVLLVMVSAEYVVMYIPRRIMAWHRYRRFRDRRYGAHTGFDDDNPAALAEPARPRRLFQAPPFYPTTAFDRPHRRWSTSLATPPRPLRPQQVANRGRPPHPSTVGRGRIDRDVKLSEGYGRLFRDVDGDLTTMDIPSNDPDVRTVRQRAPPARVAHREPRHRQRLARNSGVVRLPPTIPEPGEASEDEERPAPGTPTREAGSEKSRSRVPPTRTRGPETSSEGPGRSSAGPRPRMSSSAAAEPAPSPRAAAGRRRELPPLQRPFPAAAAEAGTPKAFLPLASPLSLLPFLSAATPAPAAETKVDNLSPLPTPELAENSPPRPSQLDSGCGLDEPAASTHASDTSVGEDTEFGSSESGEETSG